MIPSSGNSTSGSRAVAKSGMASVIHQMAMSAATAAKRLAGSLSGTSGKIVSNANATTPRTSPTVRVLFDVFGPGGAVACDSTAAIPDLR